MPDEALFAPAFIVSFQILIFPPSDRKIPKVTYIIKYKILSCLCNVTKIIDRTG